MWWVDLVLFRELWYNCMVGQISSARNVYPINGFYCISIPYGYHPPNRKSKKHLIHDKNWICWRKVTYFVPSARVFPFVSVHKNTRMTWHASVGKAHVRITYQVSVSQRYNGTLRGELYLGVCRERLRTRGLFLYSGFAQCRRYVTLLHHCRM